MYLMWSTVPSFGPCGTENHCYIGAEPTKLMPRRYSGIELKALGANWNMEMPMR